MMTQAGSCSIFPLFGEPKDAAGHLPPQREERTQLDGAKKIRVMVIDDESLIADTVVEILSEEGFEATALPTGNSAIEMAGSWQPDIVLSDVIMPGLNGIETGIRIREIVPSCRIILFSGQAATVDLLEKAREQGHRFDILAKPIKPEHLIQLIRKKYLS
jgi:CheY-like chemotaxis protein